MADKFKCIFLKENPLIVIAISLKFITTGPIDNKVALLQVMAWHQTGSKPFPEPVYWHHIASYWGRDKMAVIFPTTFSNAFSWMKMYE